MPRTKRISAEDARGQDLPVKASRSPAKARPRRTHQNKEASVPAAPPPAADCPRDVAGIAAFVGEAFGLHIPSRRVCPNHQSPMDYLAASFLDQSDLLVWANRGGGKTMLAAVATLLDAIFHSPSHIRVLGGSFDQSDRLADYIRDMLERRSDLLDGSPTRHRVKLLTGSDIRMLAQSQRAVRGQHVQKIRCDEVDLFDADVWRAVQFATRSAGKSRGSIEVLSTLHRSGGLMERLVQTATSHPASPNNGYAAANQPQATRQRQETAPSTENLGSGKTSSNDGQTLETETTFGLRSSVLGPPVSGSSMPGYRLVRWCLWEVIEPCPPGRRCEECPLADDCRGAARGGEGFFRIDDAIAIKARSSRAAWEAEMLCLGAQRDWLVFGEFSTGRHVSAVDYCPDWPLYRAIDFGYRNPLVCLWIQLTPGGRVHVIGEYVRPRLALTQHAEEIHKRSPGPVQATYVDPAGRAKESTSGAACTDILAAAGIPCTWRGSTIAEGLELIREALAPASGEPTLAIHPRCRGLIDAFNKYHYPPPGSAASGADGASPVKDGPDHCIDALRYFFINRMRPSANVKRKAY